MPPTPLPEIDRSLYVRPSEISAIYEDAVQSLTGPDTAIGTRISAAALSIVTAPLAFVDGVFTGIENVPDNASVAGQLAAMGSLSTDPDDKIVAYGNAFTSAAFAFVNAGGAIDPLTGFASPAGVLKGELSVGRSGLKVTTPNAVYQARSPLYLDSAPGQLNAGIPVGVRSPLVKIGRDGVSIGAIENTTAGSGGKISVQMYDVMTYGESKAGAVVGDELTGDHIPSHAAIRQNVETTLGRELTADEAIALRDSTNTVIVAQDLHAAGRTYFGANTQVQVAADSLDLTWAAMRDQASHLENAPGLGYSPARLQSSFGRLNQANQQLFNQLSTEQSIVEFFTKQGVY